MFHELPFSGLIPGMVCLLSMVYFHVCSQTAVLSVS